MKYLALSLLFLSSTLYADRNFAMKGLVQANATLMGNPSLPTLHEDKGWTFALTPASFKTTTSTPKDEAINDGGYVDISGSGLSLLIHKNAGKRLGYFIMGMGSNLSGEAESNFGGNSVAVTNIESSLFQLGGGITYKLSTSKTLPIQFILGPSYTSLTLKQTIVTGSGDDFDMELNPGLLSYFAGVQMGVYLNDWIALKPYFLMGDLLSEEDKCQEYTPSVRSFGSLWDFSDPECQQGQNSSTSTLYVDPSFSILGLNFLIPKWNFSINVYTSADELQDFQDAPIEMISFTLTL